MRGGAGDDALLGGDGSDTLLCNAGGNDNLKGGIGADILRGGDGNDDLLGADGDDVICGYEGADTIRGEGGTDILLGGAGADVFVLPHGVGIDRAFDFEDRFDRFSFAGNPGIDGRDDITIVETAGSTVVLDGKGGRLVIAGADPTLNGADDFIF